MPAKSNYKIGLEWVDEGGDGEECSICGDACFLTARNLVATWRRETGAPTRETVLSLCQSCRSCAADMGEI